MASLTQCLLCDPSSLVSLESGTGSSVCGEASDVWAMTHASKRSSLASLGYILRAWHSASPGR